MTRSLLLSHQSLLDHLPPAHPESRLRLESILTAISASSFRESLNLSIDRLATRDELLLNHSPHYVDTVFSWDGQNGQIDSETLLSPGSVKAARMAAGLGLELTEQILSGKAQNGFALIRPPGHHARSEGGMGFCIFNTIAIAAKKALALGVKRILIVDWDVHHGNGTQETFYEDERVMFIDLHQENLFPSTSGLITEMGNNKGLGYTVNVPLPHSCRDVDYLTLFRSLVDPLAKEYRPELILVSAGFDAHISDPLASMSLSTKGFELLARNVVQLAHELTEGKVAFFLEGGYDPVPLAQNVLGCVAALHDTAEPPNFVPAEEPFEEIEAMIQKIYEIRNPLSAR